MGGGEVGERAAAGRALGEVWEAERSSRDGTEIAIEVMLMA